MFLTKTGGFIVKPLSTLIGKIFGFIYDIFSNIGIDSIGITIIIFTVFVRLFFIPSMVKQNRSSKITAYIQPEINKVTKKYKGKKDQESMMAQQRETKAIQDKYGIGLASGCLSALIQFPIFMAVYRVIYNLPAYVDKIKDIYSPIANKIIENSTNYQIFENYRQTSASLSAISMSDTNINSVIDVLAKIPSSDFGELAAQFSANPELSNMITESGDKISHIYRFFGGIDLTATPGLHLTMALIIPILSLVFQFLSMKATPQQSSGDPTQEQTMKSMRTFLYVMPIMSFFITVNVPGGVGLYWATGSLLSFITSVAINAYFKKCDMEKILEKAKIKAAKKMEKRKAKGKKSFWEKMQEAAMGQNPESEPKVNSNIATTKLKSYTSSSSVSNDNSNVKYRPGSLASKANIMQRYNDGNNGGK